MIGCTNPNRTATHGSISLFYPLSSVYLFVSSCSPLWRMKGSKLSIAVQIIIINVPIQWWYFSFYLNTTLSIKATKKGVTDQITVIKPAFICANLANHSVIIPLIWYTKNTKQNNIKPHKFLFLSFPSTMMFCLYQQFHF